MAQGILLSGGSDIDIMIQGVFSYKLFGQTLWVTTTHISILLVMLTLIILACITSRVMKHATEVPGTLQNIMELIVEMLDKMVKGGMGKSASRFRNYIMTVFCFILLSNLSGLLGLRPPTADYGVTLPLALITFFLIHYHQIKTNKLSGYLKGYLDPWPIWAPINLIGNVAVPISLSLRLFANILSGVVMMALVYGLLNQFALVWPAALHIYFDMFSGSIQTYVFCMLTMTYVADAVGEGT